MLNKSNWDDVKTFYKESFDIPGDLVDILSVSDIVLMCVSGASNESIAETLEVEEDFVCEVIKTVLDFDGWSRDLTVNPYGVFLTLRVGVDLNLEEFVRIVGSRDTSLTTGELETLYSLCESYNKLENRIEKEWV